MDFGLWTFRTTNLWTFGMYRAGNSHNTQTRTLPPNPGNHRMYLYRDAMDSKFYPKIGSDDVVNPENCTILYVHQRVGLPRISLCVAAESEIHTMSPWSTPKRLRHSDKADRRESVVST